MDGAARRGVAAVRRGAIICIAPLLAAACGRLQGFGGEQTPLVSFDVVFHGDLAPLRPPGVTDVHALRVALVWGAQWLTEPFCVLPAESPEAAAVIAAGCRDPFGFVPNVVSVGAPIEIDVPATLTLSKLPGVDVMVGDVTARVAYATLVVFDDRNDTGTLDLLRRFWSFIDDREGAPAIVGPEPPDIIYGASFVTMTAPDRRVAYREGGFDALSAFYPRAGCEPPPPGFSVLAAGGFSAQSALAALVSGALPQEDPSLCAAHAPDATTIAIDARAPAEVQEIGCEEPTNDSSVRYLEPPPGPPDLANRNWACAHLPTFETGGAPSDLIQLVVASRATDRCKFLTHYTLRGCREDVNCASPDWDFTASPPAWWRCGP
jgi:hypothetical protein